MPEQTVRTQQDPALQAAWKRFWEFDKVSVRQKTTTRRIRIPIILLTFFASALAVAISYKEDIAVIKDIRNILRIILFILPIVAAGLMTYAYKFSPSLSWVAYRVGAESIRQQIYLYRLQASDYADKDAQEQQVLLLDRVDQVMGRIHEMGATVPFMRLEVANLPDAVKQLTDVDEDDGFSAMSGEEYFFQRVRCQRDWYIKRLHEDYRNLSRSQIAIISLTGFGSLLAVLALEPLVAVSTAAGVALGMYIQLQMYGYTYGNYHLTANRLETEVNKWSILTDAQKNDPTTVAEFVGRIETIFQQEREAWIDQASQAQMATEQALMKRLGMEAENKQD